MSVVFESECGVVIALWIFTLTLSVGGLCGASGKCVDDLCGRRG